MRTAIDRRREFRKKTGKKRGTVRVGRDRSTRRVRKGKRTEKEARREGERRRTSGLISQRCDLFALYTHKEPTLLCHYVTKKGVIGQQGPPVRPYTSNPWRRMAHGYGYRSFFRLPLAAYGPPQASANTPVIFSPFRISLYYFLPRRCHSRRIPGVARR